MTGRRCRLRANRGRRHGPAPSLRGCNQPPMLMPMPTDDQVTAGNPDGRDDPATVLGGRDYGATLWEPSPSSPSATPGSPATWTGCSETSGRDLAGYDELWQWSVAEPGGVLGVGLGLLRRARPPGRRAGAGGRPDAGRPLVRRDHAQLRAQRAAAGPHAPGPDSRDLPVRGRAGAARSATPSSRPRWPGCAPGLRALGVTAGDRVAAYVPNIPEALVGLLATASLGAIWSSCSPDFGAHSVIDRLAQISPKVLIAVDGYPYGGKWFDRRQQVADIAAELPSLEALITVDYGAVAAGEGATGPAGGGLDRRGAGRGRARGGWAGRRCPRPAPAAEADGVRRGAVRSSAVGAVLVGHHRAAQADRARARRDRARAPEGDGPAPGPGRAATSSSGTPPPAG